MLMGQNMYKHNQTYAFYEMWSHNIKVNLAQNFMPWFAFLHAFRFARWFATSSIVQTYLHQLVPNVLHKYDFSESCSAGEVLPRDIPPEATFWFIVWRPPACVDTHRYMQRYIDTYTHTALLCKGFAYLFHAFKIWCRLPTIQSTCFCSSLRLASQKAGGRVAPGKLHGFGETPRFYMLRLVSQCKTPMRWRWRLLPSGAPGCK